MPSAKMIQLGKAWAMEKKRRGLSRVVGAMPGGQRRIDRRFLENEMFLDREGVLHSHIVQQLAKSGAAELLVKLVNLKVDVNTPDRAGRCATHFAAANGKGVALQELLKHKASVNSQDRMGKTPLHLAIEAGNSLMVKEIVLAKAELEVRDKAGRSPLLLAILLEKKNQECPGLYTQSVVAYLVAIGAIPGTADADGRNAYHYAVQTRDVEKLAALCDEAVPKDGRKRSQSLKALKALNFRDRQGLSPLGLAASRGDLEAVKTLIAAKADTASATNDGMQPLHWAIIRCNMPVCLTLMQHKADVHALCHDGSETFSALGLAAHCGFSDMVKYLLHDRKLTFEHGVEQEKSGIDPVDMLVILNSAPIELVTKYQQAAKKVVDDEQKRERDNRAKAIQNPTLFDGRRLAPARKGDTYFDHADRVEGQRHALREARAAALLAKSEQSAMQKSSVDEYLQKALRSEEEIEDEKFEKWKDSLPEKWKSRSVPNFKDAHEAHKDALTEFIQQRRRRIGDDPDDIDPPSFLDPSSERTQRRREIQESYRARLLATLDKDTSRFYLEQSGADAKTT